MLVDREQAQVLGLKRFHQGRHSLRAKFHQALSCRIPPGRVRKLGNQLFYFALFGTCQPIHDFILMQIPPFGIRAIFL
jgi:hypothetical protein